MGSPVGWCRTEWQAELAGPMVFSLHRALLGTRFQPSLLPALTFTFPLLPAPLPARNECGGNLAKDCEKMKTFLKWHVPVVSAGRQSLGAAGPDPCLSPKYPKYVPSLAAKPQQCPPSHPPSALGPRVCTETGLPQGPGGASAAKGGALASLALARRAPGWRWPSAARPAQAPDCAGPARHSQSRFARRVCPLAGEGRPAPASSRRGSGRTLGALAPRPASGADPPCGLLESHFLPRPLSRHENLEEAVWGSSVGSWVQGRDANRKRQALDSGGPRPAASRPSPRSARYACA